MEMDTIQAFAREGSEVTLEVAPSKYNDFKKMKKIGCRFELNVVKLHGVQGSEEKRGLLV